MSNKYVKSSCAKHPDLLVAHGINQTFKCFEIIGIYAEYIECGKGEDFDVYYAHRYNEKKYKYRNDGIRVLYAKINESLKDNQYPYSLSKHDLRRFGITYALTPVRFYESYGEVLSVIFDYIFSDEEKRLPQQERLVEVFLNRIFENEIQNFLKFENTFLDLYVGAGRLTRRERYASAREKIVALLNNVSNK